MLRKGLTQIGVRSCNLWFI